VELDAPAATFDTETMNRRDALALMGALPAGIAIGLAPDLAVSCDGKAASLTFVPDRELDLTLSDGLRRQHWTYMGQPYTEERDAIVLNEGEHVRVVLLNDTDAAESIAFEGQRFELPAGKALALDLAAESLKSRSFRSDRTQIVRSIQVRPSYQSHALFAA
jgi:FtsP/CotA-like multicopper oxidase with cupredoxin domain